MATLNRTEWLQRRKAGIGGSDVAALLGVSPWKTPLDVYYDKIGAEKDEPETEAMRIGTELEDYVARSYERETGLKVVRFNTLLQHGHSIGNLDRLVIPEGEKIAAHQGELRTDRFLECKTSSSEEWEEVPEHYLAQVQHYLGLDDKLQHADVAALFLGFGKSFRIYRVEKDADLIKAMQTAVEKFWAEHVEKRIPPAPTCEADCRRLWEAHEPGKIVEADEALAQVAADLRAINAEIKAKEAQADELKGRLMAAMGDGEELRFGLQKLATWKNNKPSTKTDWQALAAHLEPSEELVKEYTTTKPGARVFRLAAAK